MHTLILIAVLVTPPTSKNEGSIQMKFASREECLQARETILSTWKIDRYRISGSCIFLGNK